MAWLGSPMGGRLWQTVTHKWKVFVLVMRDVFSYCDIVKALTLYH